MKEVSMTARRIAVGSDHAGYELKKEVTAYLTSIGHEVLDLGAYSADSVDYPDYGHLIAESIESGKAEIGVTICGSGNGINMTANKHQAIRAALCWQEEISRLARAHNDANVCSLPARFITLSEAKQILDAFLNTPFEGGRHCARVDKIPSNSFEKKMS
jgi:ribose 5-phosphate isomerase B